MSTSSSAADPALAAALATLQRRIDRYISAGDSAAVLDPHALADVDRVWELAAPDGTGDLVAVDAKVALAIASLHWCRYAALPGLSGKPDLRRALEMFLALYDADPAYVPSAVRDLLSEQSVDQLTGSEDPDRSNDLGADLVAEFQLTGSTSSLDRAIMLFLRASQNTPPGGGDQARYLSNLGGALLLRYLRRRRPDDLERAIRTGLTALAIPGLSGYSRAAALSNMAVALRTRFERKEDLGDLDLAISMSRDAVAALPSQHRERAAFQAVVGALLRARFETTGDWADLSAALAAAGQRDVHTEPLSPP
jgi:hypothetical protein